MATLGIQVKFQGGVHISLRVLTSLFLVEIFHFGGVFRRMGHQSLFFFWHFLALLCFEKSFQNGTSNLSLF